MVVVNPWVLIAISVIAIVESGITLVRYSKQKRPIKKAQIAIKVLVWVRIVIAVLLLLYSMYFLNRGIR